MGEESGIKKHIVFIFQQISMRLCSFWFVMVWEFCVCWSHILLSYYYACYTIIFQNIRETINLMFHSSSKAINISVHITILKKLNSNHVLIQSFKHWATSTNNENIACVVPVDLSQWTDSLLHYLLMNFLEICLFLFMFVYLHLKRKK